MLLRNKCAWCDGFVADANLMVQNSRIKRTEPTSSGHSINASTPLTRRPADLIHPATLEYSHRGLSNNISGRLATSIYYNPIIYVCSFIKGSHGESIIKVIDPYHYACLAALFDQPTRQKGLLAAIRDFTKKLITLYEQRSTHPHYTITHEFAKQMMSMEQPIILQSAAGTKIPLKNAAAQFLKDRRKIIQSGATRDIGDFFIRSWQTIFTADNLQMSPESRPTLAGHLATIPPEFTPYDFYVLDIGDQDHRGEFCLALPLDEPRPWFCCGSSHKWQPVFQDAAPV